MPDIRPPQQTRFAERDIFGSDSELSDAPDADDEELERPIPVPASTSALAGALDNDESSGDSGDEYVQDRAAAGAAKNKKRAGRRPGAGGEGVGGRKRVQKKRKRAQRTEEELKEMPKGEADKMRLDMAIDDILKPKKSSRPKKRKKDEDVMDRVADEEVSRLREAMLAAAEDDEKSRFNHQPATMKLKLLPQVMEVLRKSGLSQSIVDNNLLEGVRRWLEPLPDRSLPALNIQKEFLETLQKLEYIDTNVLKESKLGRVVLFYTKCKRVTPEVARVANALVSAWSRPIIKRSASYRDRAIPMLEDAAEDGPAPRPNRLTAILARAREGENDRNRVRKNAVMIPQRELGTYTVAPRNHAVSVQSSVTMDTERRRRNADRIRSLTRKLSQK